jgi:hypothetical protein
MDFLVMDLASINVLESGMPGGGSADHAGRKMVGEGGV